MGIIMTNSEEKRLAGGYLFSTIKDARLAEKEKKQIAYLEARLDYSKPEDILYIYDKTLQEGVFRTPVGISYLKHLQDFLLNQSSVDPGRVAAIPVSPVGDAASGNGGRTGLTQRELEKERRKYHFTISVILNILLVIGMLSMFVISLNSDQPNIINYKNAVTNQYASWEQELRERETIIREKERALMIEGELDNAID